MSSDDYGQVSTVLSRLRTFKGFFLPGTPLPNPLRIA